MDALTRIPISIFPAPLMMGVVGEKKESLHKLHCIVASCLGDDSRDDREVGSQDRRL